MRTAALLASLLLAAPAATAQQAGSVAVRAGTVILADGTELQNGTVVVENGRITAIGGADVEVPFDVLLHEFPEGTVFCGYHEAHTSGGLDRANENIPIAPFLDVRDSIDPVSFFFEDALRNGTVALGVIPGNRTILGGRGRVVSPHGMTVEAMTVHDDMGVKVAIGPQPGWSRAAQLAELREAEAALERKLHKLGRDLQHAAATEADREDAGEEIEDEDEDGDPWDSAGGFVRFGEDFPGKELISEEDLDDPDRAFVRLLNGDERLWVWAPEATDVMHAIDWLEGHGLLDESNFVVTSAAWKGAEMLAESGRGVVIDGDPWHVERDPITWKEKRTFAPKVLHEAGVPFALTSVPGRMGPHLLAYQAATCVREGLPRRVALNAITATPARLWGLEERLGGLKEGADGTFVVLDDDPLAVDAQVLQVWLRGTKAYDREEDERLQRLLEGASQ